MIASYETKSVVKNIDENAKDLLVGEKEEKVEEKTESKKDDKKED